MISARLGRLCAVEAEAEAEAEVRVAVPVLVSVAKSSELIGSGRSCQIGLVSFGSLRSGRVASHRMHNLMCVEVVLREIYVDFPY